jgi:hypothetical protein
MRAATHTQILLRLKDLKLDFPKQSICHHLSLATADYGDIFKMDDEELLAALTKYKEELEINTVPDNELERIIEEGKNLDILFKKEFSDDEGYWED